MCTRQTDRERRRDRKREITPRGDGHAAIPSPPFSSRDLGHAHTRTCMSFKSPGLECEPWSTTWESSDIVITLTAGPTILLLSIALHQEIGFIKFISTYFQLKKYPEDMCTERKIERERMTQWCMVLPQSFYPHLFIASGFGAHACAHGMFFNLHRPGMNHDGLCQSNFQCTTLNTVL